MEQELLTLPEHLSSSPFFTCFCGVCVVHGVKLYAFTVLVPYCDVRYNFRVKTFVSILRDSFLFCRGLIFVFVFTYIYWCPKRFPYQMMFFSLNSNTTGVTSGAGNAHPSGAPQSIPRFSLRFVLLDLWFSV